MKDVSNEWQAYWQTSCKGRAVFEICPKVNINRLHGNFYLKPILTGHGVLASYQHKFFNKDSKCACGHVLEDRYHLIFQCSKWREIRQKYFPANFSTLPQLLQSNSVRSGLEIILKQRLEETLCSTADNIQ
ncbi:RNase H domain-containing protein [Caerostris darwini]|uniref:RNase H domain-containing protein n=1 Tax=Caerostris darwini TaxID=1538125 RepID=A0AAV4QGU2_9ARAC|nr:RNase H domain-containing protein [Caerostris darwini]